MTLDNIIYTTERKCGYAYTTSLQTELNIQTKLYMGDYTNYFSIQKKNTNYN